MNTCFDPPTLEVHIPISPTQVFFNMVHYFVHSLRNFGGRYANAQVVLSIGDEHPIVDLHERLPWLETHQIRVAWADVDKFRKYSWFSNAIARFHHEFRSDVVLLLDADVLVAAPIDELVEQVYRERVLAGLIAHVAPFKSFEEWQRIYDACGMGKVHAICEHTGWQAMFHDEARRYCPPYFNFGVICGVADIISRIGEEFYPIFDAVSQVNNSFFRGQLTLSLAVTKLGIPYRRLKMRYNAANDPFLEARHPEEMQNAHLLHLLRDNQFYKTELFGSLASVETYLARNDLVGLNCRIQEVLRAVHPLVKAEYREV